MGGLLAKGYLFVKNILMAVKDCENTTIASPIVKKTLELASAFSSKVLILHIAPPSREPPYNVDSKIFHREVSIGLRREQDFLDDLAKCMREEKIDVTALLVRGSLISTILQESERIVADLVILGHQKHSYLYRTLMSNSDEGLLAKCSCSIMFVPI